MNQVTEKIQQVSQMKLVDGAAVATGFAVWADKIPTIVGLFTILWLGMQMVINFPKLCKAVTDFYRWTKVKFTKEPK